MLIKFNIIRYQNNPFQFFVDGTIMKSKNDQRYGLYVAETIDNNMYGSLCICSSCLKKK